jgi:hypothetical protein
MLVGRTLYKEGSVPSPVKLLTAEEISDKHALYIGAMYIAVVDNKLVASTQMNSVSEEVTLRKMKEYIALKRSLIEAIQVTYSGCDISMPSNANKVHIEEKDFRKLVLDNNLLYTTEARNCNTYPWIHFFILNSCNVFCLTVEKDLFAGYKSEQDGH